MGSSRIIDESVFTLSAKAATNVSVLTIKGSQLAGKLKYSNIKLFDKN
jgi:hypothetical protein